MPSDGTSPAPDAESTSALRRARKRATDRKSQRNHRERQRAYVRELERTVAALNSSTNTDARVAALLAENAAFRQRCEVLSSQLSRIRAVAGETSEEGATQPPAQPAPASPSPFPFDALGNVLGLSVAPADPSSSEDALDSTELLPPPLPLDTVPDCGAPDFFTDAVLLDLDALKTPDISLVPAVSLFDSAVSLSFQAAPGLPRYTRPQGPADRLIYAMLEEARAEHLAGSFDASEPTLRRLLTDGPVDTLSFRLLHYIKSYGPMPMHWLLATFWVQYLYLRWNVLGTAEAYARVPHFLRPASLERAIPHSICINMLVWPDVRHALIRDALTIDPIDVSLELVKNLPTHWPHSFAMTGEAMNIMDVYQMIELQAARLDFWKVGPGFLNTYPQYKGCNLGHDLQSIAALS